LKITENLHVGIFWIDRKVKGRWRWYGKDLIKPILVKLEELNPPKPHPCLNECHAFGRYFTSGGYVRSEACLIRLGERCRLTEEDYNECRRISKLKSKEWRKALGVGN